MGCYMKSSESQAKPMCQRCGRVFSTLQYMSKHCALKHGLIASEVACSLCRDTLSSYQDYKAHTCLAHDQGVHSLHETRGICGLCSGNYLAEDMWRYIRVSHLYRSSQSIEYPLCAQLVAVKSSKSHYAEQHPSVSCFRCSEVLNSIRVYSHHFSSIHKATGKAVEKVHQKHIRCGLCDHVSCNSATLMKHVFSVHLGPEPNNSKVCIYCCQAFPLTEYATHLNSQHASIQCLLCNKSFCRAEYNTHFNSHISS